MHSEQFLSFSSNSEISEQRLVLLKVGLSETFPQCFSREFLNFLSKRKQILLWVQAACSRTARPSVFKRKFRMADEACLKVDFH